MRRVDRRFLWSGADAELELDGLSSILGRRSTDAKRAELRADRCEAIVDEFSEWLKATRKFRILLLWIPAQADR